MALRGSDRVRLAFTTDLQDTAFVRRIPALHDRRADRHSAVMGRAVVAHARAWLVDVAGKPHSNSGAVLLQLPECFRGDPVESGVVDDQRLVGLNRIPACSAGPYCLVTIRHPARVKRAAILALAASAVGEPVR